MENITLLPQPDSGWVWKSTEVRVGQQVFWAMMQVKEPPPPVWWEELYDSPQISHGLTAITFLIVAGKKIWNAWKGGKNG